MAYRIRGVPVGKLLRAVHFITDGYFGSGSEIFLPGDQVALLRDSMGKEERQAYIEDIKGILEFPQYVVWDAEAHDLWYVGEIVSADGCRRKALLLDVVDPSNGTYGRADVISCSDVSDAWIAAQRKKGDLFVPFPEKDATDMAQLMLF